MNNSWVTVQMLSILRLFSDGLNIVTVFWIEKIIFSDFFLLAISFFLYDSLLYITIVIMQEVVFSSMKSDSVSKQ
jgi:hypothetical protein